MRIDSNDMVIASRQTQQAEIVPPLINYEDGRERSIFIDIIAMGCGSITRKFELEADNLIMLYHYGILRP